MEAAMKAPMQRAGCWPSASMTSAWVKPARSAAIKPSKTAAPLPPFSARANTRSAGSTHAMAVSASHEPSVLPSTITHTGFHSARAARTVSGPFAPGL
jgi:hypothetical protein